MSDLGDVAYDTVRADGVRPEEVAEGAELERLIADVECALAGLRGLAARIGQADRGPLPFTAEQAARREAEAWAEAAELRLKRSVNTNIGRQRTIQKLRKRVTELEQALEDLRAGERN